jgi:NADH pyrophosphatase NudC (nudix superfamily)
MDLPPVGRYRRRFIVEFGPEDSELVDRMGVAHKTKRAAILAGLRLLDSDEIDQLRTRSAQLKAEVKTTKAAVATARSQARQSRADRAQAVADLRAERAAHRESKAKLRAAGQTIADHERTLDQLTAERARLVALIPHHAFCGSCGKLVPEAEWAEAPARDGFDVYHQPDGYRAKTSMFVAATVLFWRKTAGLKAVRPTASR